MKEILSAENAQYKLLVKLLKAKKYRHQEKSYLAEGLNFLDIPVARVKAYLLASSNRQKVKEWNLPEEKVILLSDSLFKELSQDPASQGLIVWTMMQDHQWHGNWELDCSKRESLNLQIDNKEEEDRDTPLYLALEDIQDAGNMGTMLRTAEAAGVTAVFCSSRCVDLYHPKVIKAAASSLSRLRIYTDCDLPSIVRGAQEKGVFCYATTPVRAEEYSRVDYSKPSLFLIGNEGNGLSDEIFAVAEGRIYIPMSGEIESLNAAISAAILLYEAKRQRSLIKI